MQSYEKATADFTMTNPLEPKDARTLYLLGLANRHLNNLKQSYSDLSKAAEPEGVGSLEYELYNRTEKPET